MKSEIWFTHHKCKGLTISHTRGSLIWIIWVFTIAFSSVWLHIVFQFPNQQYKPLSLEQLPAPDRKRKQSPRFSDSRRRWIAQGKTILWVPFSARGRADQNRGLLRLTLQHMLELQIHLSTAARWVLYSEEDHICLIMAPVTKIATARRYSVCSLVFPRSLAVRVGPCDYFWPPGYAWQLLHHFWVKVDNRCGPSLFPPAMVTLGVTSSM